MGGRTESEGEVLGDEEEDEEELCIRRTDSRNHRAERATVVCSGEGMAGAEGGERGRSWGRGEVGGETMVEGEEGRREEASALCSRSARR
jgi:hypothetical protein